MADKKHIGEPPPTNIWASTAHPVDSKKGHLTYGYWAAEPYDGNQAPEDPPGVLFVAASELEAALDDRDALLAALREVAIDIAGQGIKLSRGPARLMREAIKQASR